MSEHYLFALSIPRTTKQIMYQNQPFIVTLIMVGSAIHTFALLVWDIKSKQIVRRHPLNSVIKLNKKVRKDVIKDVFLCQNMVVRY